MISKWIKEQQAEDEKWIKIQNASDYKKWLDKVYWKKYWVSIHMNTIYQDTKNKDCMKWEVSVHDRQNNNKDIITIPFEIYDDAKKFFLNIKPYLVKLRKLDNDIQRTMDNKTLYCRNVKKKNKTAKVKPNVGWIGEEWDRS